MYRALGLGSELSEGCLDCVGVAVTWAMQALERAKTVL